MESDKNKELISLSANDQIEHEEFLEQRINRVREFTNHQGNLGDDSSDIESLDQHRQQEANRYDPALSTGGETTIDKKARDVRIKDKNNVGMSYNKDRYARKRKNQ